MLRRVGMQLGLGRAGMGGGGKSAGRWWALTVLVPLLCGAVPIFLVDSVLRDVKLDVSTWQSQIAQLTEKAAQYAAEQAEVDARVGELKAALQAAAADTEHTGGSLRQLHEGECGVAALAKRHRAELQQLVQTITRDTQQELAELARGSKQEASAAAAEQRELEARTPESRLRTQALREELKWKRREVQVGRALVDNDPVYLQSFLGRLTAGVDSYSGAYMLNAADCPREGQPLMMPKAQTLTDDSLGDVTEELLQVLPKQDPFIRPSRVVYQSCAVVGSSGMHLFHRRGDFIDSHEAVIRFNAAPTAGFEEFVGSKTTVRFVNRMHFGYQEKPSEAVLQQVTTPEVLKEFIAQKQEMPAQKLFMVAPDFHRYVVRQLAAPPTNGLYGVFFALQRCRSITLVGFVRGGDAHVPYHYFDTDAPVVNQRRRDLQEWPLILEIARSSPGRVTMADPCQTQDERDNTEPCEQCPPGSMCQIGTGLPVAMPGYCMESGRADCFYACVDASECPGFANSTVCDGRRHLDQCAEL